MSTPFPSEVLAELAVLSGSPANDFSSVDFVGEPWAWVDRLARDQAERSEYLRDSGAAGPLLVDYREAFIHNWGQEISAKLMRVLLRGAEEHFALVAQGLHRRPGFYVGRFKPIVSEARAILDPLYAAAVPEEHRKQFLAARHLEVAHTVPAGVRLLGLQMMKAKASVSRKNEEPPGKDPPESTGEKKGGKSTPPLLPDKGKKVDEEEAARRRRALEGLRVAQNLIPPESTTGKVELSPSRLQKAALAQERATPKKEPPPPPPKKPLNAKQLRQQEFLRKKKEAKNAQKNAKKAAATAAKKK